MGTPRACPAEDPQALSNLGDGPSPWLGLAQKLSGRKLTSQQFSEWLHEVAIKNTDSGPRWRSDISPAA